MEFHADPANVMEDISPSHASAPVKRFPARRAPAGGGELAILATATATATLPAAATTAVQVVHTEEECNALIKRIRQLESESALLSKTLTKVCDENSRLSGQIATLEEKVRTLAQEPLKNTSVLHSLFEPEKTGWFGGSKSAAKAQLQELSDALQSEFITYKASHTSSNEEVQALVEGLHNAHLSAQELSAVVSNQQELISGGSLAVNVRIVPFDESIGDAATVRELQKQLQEVREQAELTERQLRSSEAEVHATKAENARLRNELVAISVPAAAAASGSRRPLGSAPSLSENAATGALERVTSERDELRSALEEVRCCADEKETDLALHNEKAAQLQQTLAQMELGHTEELSKFRQQLTESSTSLMACGHCDALRQELEEIIRDASASTVTVQDLCTRMLDVMVQHEGKKSAFEKKIAGSVEQLSREQQQLHHSVLTDDYVELSAERESLSQEINSCRQHIAVLEAKRNVTSGAADANALSDAQVLETLRKTKKHISKLEAERSELLVQLQQAQSSAVALDTEMRELRARSEEDKQRVSFLLKKCSVATAEAQGVAAQLESFEERVEKQSLELKQERRKTEKMAELQRQFDELSKEKKALEDRLAATQKVEERLVKAKETIAYMELAQSSTINMSQYAELKAEKERLQNTMKPLERKLEEAKQEIDRLKAVTDAQQAISCTQNSNVRAWQDQVTALSESEAKLRDKVSMLSTENARLTKVNTSLEQQMNDMQDGIKAMAEHLEKDRASAKATAEANSQKQIQTLSDELAQARATIAEVQARDGQYVAEGLYQSVVAERDRASEEKSRMAVELEKRKSEISLYRQTIADLEQENDQRVREIEELQDRYQRDRAALSDRLAKEQARTAQLSSDMEGLTEQVSMMEAAAAKQTATIRELEQTTAKQKRVFEDKCRREEALSDEIRRLNGQIVLLQANEESAALHREGRRSNGDGHPTAIAAAVVPVSASGFEAPALGLENATVAEPDAGVKVTDCAVSSLMSDRFTDAAAPHASSAPEASCIDAFRKRIEDLKRDRDHLADELKRTQAQHTIDSADKQRTITALQTQIKNRMSTNDRNAYEAELTKSAALRKSVEALMEENAILRRQTGVAQASVVNVPASASSVAMAEAQKMDVLQLQSQLQTQQAAFDSAVASAARVAETYEARVQELEAQLRDAEEALAAATAAGGGDIGKDGDSSSLGKPVKRKAKKTKKKKTLMEQVNAMEDGDDIFAAAPSSDAVNAATQNYVDAAQLQTSLMLAQREVAQLKSENTELKATIVELTNQLKCAEDRLQVLQEDLKTVQAAADEERRGLQKLNDSSEPSLHERQLLRQPGDDSFSLNGVGGAVKSARSPRDSSIANVEMQMRRCQDEVERLTKENKNLRYKLERGEVHRGPPASCGVEAEAASEKSAADDVRKLQLQLRQKDAEMRALADQLIPAKEKLAEYMAMGDRLGLQYPFPPELGGSTVLRLKALHLPINLRSVSAPAVAAQQPRKPRSDGQGDVVSPPPRTPKGRRAL
ncbi:hypothetical protein JKF63_04305 [Porcisia hertigi]|uniref:Uncharacterized protein n=1 Tax=Porcisia hertigi TaxID=2761500 RepID=A0A836LHG5_9TRYP|nr:hypothetical protein JKF63_04305 [Porcisia hertigi]